MNLDQWLAEEHPAAKAFRQSPNEASFRALASALWSLIESEGGAGSLQVKEALYATGTAAALTDDQCRTIIDAAVPGPAVYSGGQRAASDDDEFPLARVPTLPTASTWDLPGWQILDSLGLVIGNTVRTRNTVVRFATGLQATFGGELGAYTSLLTDARDEAIARMTAQAHTLNADAIVGVSLSTSAVFEAAIEVVAIGTAVLAARLPID